jgi:hypothetical protein
MAVDIEQAGTVIGLVNQMIVPDFVVQRGRFGHERKLQEISRSVRRGSRASEGKRQCSVKARA